VAAEARHLLGLTVLRVRVATAGRVFPRQLRAQVWHALAAVVVVNALRELPGRLRTAVVLGDLTQTGPMLTQTPAEVAVGRRTLVLQVSEPVALEARVWSFSSTPSAQSQVLVLD